jgi:hypothetical protein
VPSVARISVTTDAAGADVAVDDAVVGAAPLAEAIVANPGKHTITVTRAGQPPATRVVNAKAGETLSIVLELAPAAEPAKPVAPTPVAPPSKLAEAERPRPDAGTAEATTSRSIPWVGWGVTGALAVGALTTALVARGAASDYEDKKNTFGVTRSDLVDSQDKARTWTYVAGGLAAGTLVAGGISLFFTLRKPGAQRVGAVVGPRMLGVQGAF